MNDLNAKILLEELLDFKNEVESTDKFRPSDADSNLRTEYLLKDLVSRLKRYHLVDSSHIKEVRNS